MNCGELEVGRVEVEREKHTSRSDAFKAVVEGWEMAW
jgi:hypothetical protein